MKAAFVEFVRDLRGTVRSRRQEKIREIELGWTANELTSFRLFVMGLHPSEKADVCHALSDAQATPLLEILTDFAEDDPNLMKIAFQSMEKTSSLARVFLAKKLLESKNPEIRARTCDMLGNSGEMAKDLLESALKDPHPKVQCAAIHGILRARLASLWQKLVPFLNSPDKDTRFAALGVLARVGANSAALVGKLTKILLDQEEDEQARRLAAGVLARVSSHEGRQILLNAITSAEAETVLRIAAAESLPGYNDQQAIKAVINAVHDRDVNIAKTARLSLSRRHSEDFAGILHACLDDEDQDTAELAAELLGGLDILLVEKILSDRLKTERRLPVLIAIARAMSSAGVPGAWPVLIKKLHENRIKSPQFFAALADVTEEKNFSDYAALFDQTDDNECRAVIMQRLAIFAQTGKVTTGMKRLAIRVLKMDAAKLHYAAATIAAHLDEIEDDLNSLILQRLGEHDDESGVVNVIRAMLRNRHGALAELFVNAPSAAARLIILAAREASVLGKSGDILFNRLAEWAKNNAPGAREALRNIAALDPAALAEAMYASSEPVFLIEAWSHLPQRDRFEHRPPLEILFNAVSEEDCLKILDILNDLQEAWCLKDVVTVVLTTKNEVVRQAAKKLAHALILSGCEAA